MAILIGTDEAGYGPNLGPLVISATAWRIDDADRRADLYQRLDPAVSPGPVDPDSDAIAIADSKQLYKPGGTLESLEVGVLAGLNCCDAVSSPSLAAISALRETSASSEIRPRPSPVRSWRDIWQSFDAHAESVLDDAPWHADYDEPLPTSADPRRIDRCGRLLHRHLAAADMALLAMRSRVVFPGEFNELLERHGNKASALSHATLQLVHQLLSELPPEPAIVQCDKHGGRNKYRDLLQDFFPDHFIEVYGERSRLSLYRWGPSECRIEARFRAQGEAFLPTALASMISKYLRELAMRAFNAFWARHLPDLKPTAGYPLDARRFLEQIEPLSRQLRIDRHQLWRNR